MLLLVLVGTLDFARAFQSYVGLGNSVREAARETSVHGSGASTQWGPTANDANVASAVRTRAVGLVASNIAVTSSWPSGSNAQGSEVVITASYTFRPVALQFLGGVTVPMSATTRARIQR